MHWSRLLLLFALWGCGTPSTSGNAQDLAASDPQGAADASPDGFSEGPPDADRPPPDLPDEPPVSERSPSDVPVPQDASEEEPVIPEDSREGQDLPGSESLGDAPEEETPEGDIAPLWDPTPRTADTVVDAPGHTGEGFRDANRAVNGVRGGGQFAGGFDVFSLGFQEGIDNYITLSWGGATVRNGPGADFVVFENPFEIAGGSGRFFLDLIVVLLSRDGRTFVSFPHRYLADDPTVYQPFPAVWQGFAGRYPVKYHVEDNPVDPFDHEAAGGDPFDLDDLPMDGGEAQAIREDGFRYLRLVAAPTVVNPETGDFFVRDPISNGPDIDGVIARYLQDRP